MAKKPSSAITDKRRSNKQMTRPDAGTLGSQEGERDTIHHCAQSPSKTKSSNDDPPSQDHLKSHTNDRGCPQPLRRSHSGTIATTKGANGINERQHDNYSVTFLKGAYKLCGAATAGQLTLQQPLTKHIMCRQKYRGADGSSSGETIENKGWATDIYFFDDKTLHKY